jgi:16S rRNA (guanine966-N2)-methyltransferase
MALRIIAGELKGRKLRSVRGTKTRPTAERIREAIFNILAFQIQESTVLDLFAGTGAFGIEALSRGAESVVFVDVDNDSISVLQENIRSFSLESPTKILRWDLTRNLNCLGSLRSAFNLIFMDPPYNKNMIEPTLYNLHSSQSMENGARIVVEHSYLEPVLKSQLPFEISDQRRYGKTLVSFLNYKES